jgi:hypothetical protein
VEECADIEGEGLTTADLLWGVAVPWRSVFCGGDRKWGLLRCPLGAGVGVAGWGEREVTKATPDPTPSFGQFYKGYDGNFALLESGSWEISMEAGDFAADLKISNTVLPVWRVEYICFLSLMLWH